jgi:hypothetical protein
MNQQLMERFRRTVSTPITKGLSLDLSGAQIQHGSWLKISLPQRTKTDFGEMGTLDSLKLDVLFGSFWHNMA